MSSAGRPTPASPSPLRRVRPAGGIGALARVGLMWVASHLPGERGEALVDMLRAGRAFVTGHRTRGSRQRVVSPAAASARAVLQAGDPLEALRRADAALLHDEEDVGALDVRRLALVRLGELTEAYATIRRQLRLEDSDELRRAERLLRGRLAETTPGWLPRIPGQPEPFDPQPNRVLHLLKESLPDLQNGYTLRSRYTLLAQRSAGLDPLVVTALGFPRALDGGDPPPVELVDGIPHHRLDLGRDYDVDGPLDVVLRDQAWLSARLVREVRPAILQAGSGRRGYESALVALALGRRFDLPVVYEVRSFLETTWSVGFPRTAGDDAVRTRGQSDDPTDPALGGVPTGTGGATSELSRRRSDTEIRAMLAADAVITIADAMRDDIIARGVPPDRVHVVPNGVDAEAFRPTSKDPQLLRRYGLGAVPVVGYVSTLDHRREGHDILIKSIALLRRRSREVRCLIVGDGVQRSELELLASSLGVADRVIFTGRVPHDAVAAHHALIDVFVVPRRDDRAARFVTPLKPFEAMAMARPLVVADLPALRELADPDGPVPRGLAFRPEDAEALAVAIDRLVERPDLGRALGKAGRAWVETERTWAANGPRYRSIYTAVLGARTSRQGRSPQNGVIVPSRGRRHN